jgi:nucleoside-diphosphate-sugar epimerase
MKVLVTGATGYIGAVAADALAAKNYEVLGLARSARSASALRESRPDVVVSAASVGASSGDRCPGPSR